MACHSVFDFAAIQRAIDKKDKERTILRQWLMDGAFGDKIITEYLERFEEGFSIQKEAEMSDNGYNRIRITISKHYTFIKKIKQ